MRKITLLFMVLLAAVVLVACDVPYEEEAGVYELYSVSTNNYGISVSSFEYYTIELKADGKLSVKSKGTGASSSYDADGTFEIKDGKIIIKSKVGAGTTTETYDYVDGEIHMFVETLPGVGTINTWFKFKRA